MKIDENVDGRLAGYSRSHAVIVEVPVKKTEPLRIVPLSICSVDWRVRVRCVGLASVAARN